MQRALKRLSPKDAYDRVFRMRRAFQVHTNPSRLGRRVCGQNWANIRDSAL